MTDRFLIIGGGTRLKEAGKALISAGYEAKIYDGSKPLKTQVTSSDVILLGLPASFDDTYVSSDDELKVSLRDLAAMCGKQKLILGGKMSERVKALFDIYSVRWADYSACEEFEIFNAVPTAEGAIQIAMEEFPFTIFNSRVLVTGYGKVSKALCRALKALGADCTVIARNRVQRAEAESVGLKAFDFSHFPQEAEKTQILFNTVPEKIIDKSVLSRMNSSQGIIDLASKPGGVDLDVAKTYNINVIWALSLPGKVAPVSAGAIIQKTACNIAEDLRL